MLVGDVGGTTEGVLGGKARRVVGSSERAWYWSAGSLIIVSSEPVLVRAASSWMGSTSVVMGPLCSPSLSTPHSVPLRPPLGLIARPHGQPLDLAQLWVPPVRIPILFFLLSLLLSRALSQRRAVASPRARRVCKFGMEQVMGGFVGAQPARW